MMEKVTSERQKDSTYKIIKTEILSEAEEAYILEERREKERRDNASRMSGARAEGKAEGLYEWRIEMAKKLLKRNRPINEIIEDTGLSKEEIEQLK